ncbi:hypothetical protein ADK52_34365 [Streptomyces sp. WM6372]|nr:hypothetical protein ADK52_34365 [Streptomyces sp. WM6372]
MDEEGSASRNWNSDLPAFRVIRMSTPVWSQATIVPRTTAAVTALSTAVLPLLFHEGHGEQRRRRLQLVVSGQSLVQPVMVSMAPCRVTCAARALQSSGLCHGAAGVLQTALRGRRTELADASANGPRTCSHGSGGRCGSGSGPGPVGGALGPCRADSPGLPADGLTAWPDPPR